jgi:hypothetical protein
VLLQKTGNMPKTSLGLGLLAQEGMPLELFVACLFKTKTELSFPARRQVVEQHGVTEVWQCNEAVKRLLVAWVNAGGDASGEADVIHAS